MFFDFSFYLLVAVLVMLAVLLAWRGYRHFDPDRATPIAVIYIREFFPLVLFVFLLRSFVLEPFRIPSGSMLPNLQSGDLILVSKFDFGIRLPITNRPLFSTGQPQRGDIIVFYHPDKTHLHYIKRVIGLPGDRIDITSGQVYVNQQPLLKSAQAENFSLQSGEQANEALNYVRQQTRELMPQTYPLLDFRVESDSGSKQWISLHHLDATEWQQTVEVPAGHYFVLGDNRDKSNDSRFWGFVPDSHIAGKARLIWLHLDWDFWSRVGKIDLIDNDLGEDDVVTDAKASPSGERD